MTFAIDPLSRRVQKGGGSSSNRYKVLSAVVCVYNYARKVIVGKRSLANILILSQDNFSYNY